MERAVAWMLIVASGHAGAQKKNILTGDWFGCSRQGCLGLHSGCHGDRCRRNGGRESRSPHLIDDIEFCVQLLKR